MLQVSEGKDDLVRLLKNQIYIFPLVSGFLDNHSMYPTALGALTLSTVPGSECPYFVYGGLELLMKGTSPASG